MPRTRLPSAPGSSGRTGLGVARVAFSHLCHSFKRYNVAGALTEHEQIVLTGNFVALAAALGVHCPNMVPHKRKDNK